MDIVFDWDSEKNEVLINLEHPNKEKYVHQKIYVVEINGYVYLVPFIQDGYKIFLRTIISTRKAQKEYLGK